VIWTILASVNLFCALCSYSLLAYSLAHLRWRDRGIFFVLLAIIICGQVWLIPQAISISTLRSSAVLYPIWFGDWLVSGFAIVLLCQVLRDIPRDLADAARLDGCGALRMYWHIVLPLVRPALVLLAILTVMATWTEFAAPFGQMTRQFELAQPTVINVRPLIAGSLVMTLPLIAIFFLARRYFCNTSRQAG
jgi:multiple sugar transport system permease protein